MNENKMSNRSSLQNFFSLLTLLQVGAVASLLRCIRLLPLRVGFHLGEFFGLLVYFLLPYYQKLSEKNLSIAFGAELSRREKKQIARRHFRMLGANMLTSIKIPTLSPEALEKIITIENETIWNEVLKTQDGRGVVVALSHFGNWELNAQISTFVSQRRSGAVYQPLRNKALDDLINRDRRSRGVRTFDRKRELTAATNLLRDGGILGVLIDQHAGDSGIWIPFFNKLASTSPLAATLAQKTGSHLVHVTIHTIGPARWTLRLNVPTVTENRSVAEITYDLGCQLAQEIRRSPADWFWVHNRWKLPSPAFLLSRVKRGLYIPNGITLQPFKMLVRSANWLGDACMTVPAVRALKQGRPDLHLTIVTPQKLADFWKSFSEIDEVIAIPPKASPWQVARQLRSKALCKSRPAFEAALLFPNSIRSALEVWLAGIPRRIGRTQKKGAARRWLLNQSFPEPLLTSSPHQADEYRAVVEWLGAPSQLETITREKKNQKPRNFKDPFRIGLCPGAEYGPAKRWPLDRFRQVMDRLLPQPIVWVLIGTAAEAKLAEPLVAGFLGLVENRMGKTSLAELIRMMKDLDLLLTNDTGSMHLAALFEIPTVAIFGSTEPTLTGPQGTIHHVLRHPVECSPCFRRTCPIDFRCMTRITPDEVVQAISEQLSF